jgi:hypothetical protein
MRRSSFAPCFALAFLVVGCGPSYDPPSVVDSLRVLAVRPEPASGAPGETVTLEMLVADGTPRESGETARPIEVVWLGGCHNPPSQLYYTCFPELAALAGELSENVVDTPPDTLPPGAFGVGTSFALPLPDDILSSAPHYPGQPVAFGVSYVFFAACAGELRPRPERTDRVPLACVDPASGDELDSDDFVQGFATVPTYEGARNENPRLTSVRFGSLTVPDTGCESDAECDGLGGAAPGEFGCSEAGVCSPVVRPCAADGEDCSRELVFPDIDTASAEALPGEAGKEVLWANFYATDGEFQADAQLVNDRATGWVEDHGAYFVAPQRPGELELFVTVHDERGGAAWQSFQVLVRP